METGRGIVDSVSIRAIGDVLAGDHALGVTELVVADGYPFSEDGGELSIDGDVYAYSTWVDEEDLDTDTIVLTGPTTAAYDAETFVSLMPLEDEKWVNVVQDGDGSGIEALVPHGLFDKVAEGIKDPGFELSVDFHFDGEDYILDNVVGRTPVIDGGLIDPTTLPAPTEPWTPVTAPTDAPVLTIAPFAIGALLASWDEVENAQWYDVYASLTSGFDSDDVANRVLTGVTGLSASVASIAGAQIPVDGVTPVYVVVKAVNIVGAGPASNEASGMARQADAEFLSALYGWFGTVEAQTAILGSLNVVMNVDVDGVISIGPRITIADSNAPDGKGGIIIWGDDEHTIVLARLHPDGNYLDGILVAQEITVIQALRLIGDASAIASGAKLKLENGVANPAAPTLSAGPILANWPSIPAGYVEKGICWDEDAGQWWQLLWRTSTSRAYVRVIDTAGVAGSTYLLVSPAPSPDVWITVNSIAYLDGAVYAYCRILFSGAAERIWAAFRWSTTPSAGALPLHPGSSGYEFGSGYVPAVGRTDSGTIVLTAEPPGGGDLLIYELNSGLTSYLATYETDLSSDKLDLRSVAIGSFDRGTPLIQLTPSSGSVRHYTPALFPAHSPWASSHDFLIDAGAWMGYKSSGADTGFYSSRSDAKLARYSSYFPGVGETFFARYVDTGAAGIHTASSGGDSTAVPARRFATVTLNPAPAGVTGADVYVGYGGAYYKRTESLAARSMTLTGGKVTTGVQFYRPVTNRALTSNVATLTSASHALIVGEVVLVVGVSAVFDGLHTITAVTTDTFSYAKVNANVTSAASTGYIELTNTMGGSPGEIFDDFGNSWQGNGIVDLPGLVQTEDSGAIALPLAAGYVEQASGNGPKYRRVGKLVVLVGLVKPSSGSFAAGAAVTIGTLPAGFRPVEANTHFPLATNNTTTNGRISIQSDGNVMVQPGAASTYASLGGASFFVA